MTIFTVAVKYLRARTVASILTALSVALAVSLVIASVLLTRGIKEGFVEGTTDYNLVVGAKGSPTQLVLSVVFRMDVATPNILTRTFRRLQEDPRVDAAVPLALGDAFQGFRYVATGPAYFAAFPWRRKTFSLSEGRFFHDDAPDRPTYEALLGSEAARRTGLRIGDRFYEGEEMAEYPLTVVGTLRPTRTAVLVRAKRMSDLPSLHRELNVSTETQSVLPSAVLLTIFNLLGVAEEALAAILAVVAIVVVLYVFVSMYGATLTRRREIATMRALGARRGTILRIVLAESATLATA